MTTAAERLHAFLGVPMVRDENAHRLIDEALAAERRAVVERIRLRIEQSIVLPDYIHAILDQEAAR